MELRKKLASASSSESALSARNKELRTKIEQLSEEASLFCLETAIPGVSDIRAASPCAPRFLCCLCQPQQRMNERRRNEVGRRSATSTMRGFQRRRLGATPTPRQ